MIYANTQPQLLPNITNGLIFYLDYQNILCADVSVKNDLVTFLRNRNSNHIVNRAGNFIDVGGQPRFLNFGDSLDEHFSGTDKKLTILCWARHRNTGANDGANNNLGSHLVSKSSDSILGENQRQFSLGFRTLTGTLKLDIVVFSSLTVTPSPNLRFVQSTQDFNFNEWYFLGVTLDMADSSGNGYNRFNLYSNGVSIAKTNRTDLEQGTTSNVIQNGTAPLSIGGIVSSNGVNSYSWFQGDIGKTYIYNRVLNQSEIDQLFQTDRTIYGV